MNIPPTSCFKEVHLEDEGKRFLTGRVVVIGEEVEAHYITPEGTKVYAESLGRSFGRDQILNQIFQHFLEGLEGTIATLNHQKKSLPLSIRDGSFIAARQDYIYKQFDITTENQRLLTVQIRVFQNVIHARYIKHLPNSCRTLESSEKLGTLSPSSKGLKATFEKLQNELVDVLKNQRPVGKTIEDMVNEDLLFAIRGKNLDVKLLNKYKKARENYKAMCHALGFFKLVESNPNVIVDSEICLLRKHVQLIILSPYRMPVPPDPCKINNCFNKLRRLRIEALPLVRRDPTITHFSLVSEGGIVAEKSGGVFRVYFPEVYEKCLTELTNEEIVETASAVINDEFIKYCLRFNMIPKNRENSLRKYEGKCFIEALLETRAWQFAGRFSRFATDEFNHWNKEDAHRYVAIVSYLQNQGMSLDPLCLKIYHYLRGRIELDDLGLTPDNAPEILNIVKLFEMAAGQINLNKREKDTFERDSYELKARILQITPSAPSTQVFTKTLHTEDTNRCMKEMAPSRVGRHAKEVANQYVEAKALSTTLTGLGGARGNSGSAKSTVAPKGALNVDKVKAGLKKEHPALNSQIHSEAANVFERLLQEIIGKTSMNFYLDARLIELKHLESSLLNPALTRGTTADIADFDVPLATSLMRILTRPPYGKDPCPPFEAILEGFIGIRRERGSIINHLKDNPVCKRYELYYKQGPVRHLVASKEEGKFKVHDEARFQRCLEVPSSEEIAAIIEKPLTESDLEQAVQNQDIFAHQKELLRKYLGKTLREAVVLHAKGGPS